MKKLLFCFVLLFTVVCLASCGDGSPAAPPETTPAPTTPPETTAPTECATVTFKWQGGSLTLECPLGSLPTPPAVSDIVTDFEIYAFVGWNREIVPVSGDVTYSAIYQDTPRLFTITFKWHSGQQSFEITYGSNPTAPSVPNYKSGGKIYLFDGWDMPIDRAKGNATYTATYQEYSDFGEWESVATDLSALSTAQRSFKFELSDLAEDVFLVKCEEYMAGPDSISAASSEIDRLVYTRNRLAEELLGVSVDYTYGSYAWGSATTAIKGKTKDSAVADAPDLFVYSMYDSAISVLDGSFRELSSIKGSYLDLASDGWYENIMTDISLDRSHLYLMASDYFSETYRNYTVLPVNLTMLNGAVTELGPILIPTGDTLKSGEDLSDYLFRLVLDGAWTWDTLTAMCEAIYIDTNRNGKEDNADRMGIYMDSYGGNMSISSLYSSGASLLTDGVGAAGTALEGKMVPTYPASGDALNGMFVVIGRLMAASGSLDFSYKITSSTVWFGQGLGLTAGPSRIGLLDDKDVRTMSDDFALLPLPLASVGSASDYNTTLHNTASLGAINIHSTKSLAITAYIQLLTERSEAIKHAYLENVTRRDLDDKSQLAVKTLEVVCDCVHTVREMILDNVLRARKNSSHFASLNLGDVRWHGILKEKSYQNAINAESGAFLDRYLAVAAAKQTAMNELMTEWYALETPPAQ